MRGGCYQLIIQLNQLKKWASECDTVRKREIFINQNANAHFLHTNSNRKKVIKNNKKICGSREYYHQLVLHGNTLTDNIKNSG